MGTTRIPRSAALALAVVALGALPGCVRHAAGPPPAAQPPVTQATPSADTGFGGAPVGTPTTKPPGYPTSAKGYADAVLAAWRDKSPRLADLTTPEVNDQLIEIPGPPDQHWSYVNCEGAAGSVYCTYRNNNGDQIVLRLRTDLVGKAHAAIGVTFDPTVYAATGEQYVRVFLTAWENGNRPRMLALANATTVGFVTHYTPPASYTLTSDGAAGHLYVHVTNPDGFNMTLKLVTVQLGKPHAIECGVLGPGGC